MFSFGDRLKAGFWTPSLSNTTNLDGSTAYQCIFLRVGAILAFAGKVDANPTAAAATTLGISLPVTSNIAAEEDVAGVGFCSAVQQGARLLGDATNNRITMQWLANDTANRGWSFVGMARLI